MSIATSEPRSPAAPDPTRRDFLYLATAAVGGVGAAATLWPLIDQMNPDAATEAAGGPLDIDLSQIQPGQQIVALWQSHPVFVVNRTPPALDALKTPEHLALLSDPEFDRPPAARLRGQLEPLDQARIPGAGRRLHPPRLHSQVLWAAEPDRAGGELAGRLFLPLPRLEIRPRRTSLPRRPSPLQPARPALSFRQRQDPAGRREPAGIGLRLRLGRPGVRRGAVRPPRAGAPPDRP